MGSNISATKEVYETKLCGEANRYLSLGWVLLETYVNSYGEPRKRDEQPHYVLGWLRDREAPHPPSGWDVEADDRFFEEQRSIREAEEEPDKERARLESERLARIASVVEGSE